MRIEYLENQIIIFKEIENQVDFLQHYVCKKIKKQPNSHIEAYP
jgi:hypothetical protein